ncbi:hypothetical protein J3E68DRAFT_422516 [Trichoderma sp. SZMC 28012]
MEMAEWRFDLLHDAHGDLVEDVLQCLEEIVQIAGSIPEEYRIAQFPRLETIIEEINKASDAGNIKIELALPNDTNAFIQSMMALSAVIGNKSRPPPDVAQLSSKIKPILAPLIVDLFSALSKYCRCTRVCKSSLHQAALVLSTHRTHTSDLNSSPSFTVLISGGQPTVSMTQWLETGITVCKSLAKTEIGQIQSLCALTTESNRARVNLKLVDRWLRPRNKADIQMNQFQTCKPTKLSEAFLNHVTALNFGGKICLAVVLSFAFLGFCGEPWFSGDWNMDSIFLMQTSDGFRLQPFLITDLKRKKSRPSMEAVVAYWEAKLLHHGILLMEIFKQEAFPSPKRARKALPDRKDIAQSCKAWSESIKWGHYEHWRQAVEACIDGRLMESFHNIWRPTTQDTKPLAKVGSLEECFSMLFCDAVLAPLEAEFATHWPDQNPDEVISTLKLARVDKKFNFPVNHRAGNSNVRATSSVGTITPRHISQSEESLGSPSNGRRLNSNTANSRAGTLDTTPSPCNQAQPQSHLAGTGKGSFFDSYDESDTKDIKNADAWFDCFDEIRDKLPSRDKSDKKTIKIGVLDTGIDMEIFSDMKENICCWPPGADHHDNVGHGTQVAYLLLYLAEHVDLRVCKITNSTDIKDVDIDKIADAITHFSQPGEDRVDILNLSFGFPKYHRKLEPISKAIRNAASSGVIIFAAAGNEGGNAAMSWPASLQEKKDVIPIYSSDGMGVPSGMNPGSLTDNYIYTLGLGVKSCHERVVNEKLEPIHRSGSSFATAIASATAAIILGFVDNAKTSDYPEHPEQLADAKVRIRTRQGMEMALCKMCTREGWRPYQGHYLTPWCLFEHEEKLQIFAIIRYLSPITP